MTERDWARAGREVRRRRRQLGWKNQGEAARAAGIGVTNWREVEGGAGNKRQTSFTAIETLLRWPPDMIERLAAGEDPPVHDGGDLVVRVERLEADFSSLRAAWEAQQALLADWLRRGSQQ